jgi:hypothetical protein
MPVSVTCACGRKIPKPADPSQTQVACAGCGAIVDLNHPPVPPASPCLGILLILLFLLVIAMIVLGKWAAKQRGSPGPGRSTSGCFVPGFERVGAASAVVRYI